jgi:predicted DNA-binding transcriptional regulator AlpA
MVVAVGSKPMRLMGAAELCARLGVSRQRTYKIAERPDFPEPVARLRQGTIWSSDDIDEWIRIHRRPLVDAED